MSGDTYRSYVVRVRRRAAAGDAPDTAVRLDVEDLQQGGRAAVAGERARSLADGLATLMNDESGGDETVVG